MLGRTPIIGLGLICLATGCSMYRPPSIAVAEATVTERTDEALRLDIAVNLSNPNQEALELKWFRYTVSVDGAPVFKGKRAAEATLPSSGASPGTQQLMLPAVIRFDRVPWDAGGPPAEAAWSIDGSLLYISPGEIAEILLDLGVRKPRVRFSGSGVADLAAR